jgi:hypothetical protein
MRLLCCWFLTGLCIPLISVAAVPAAAAAAAVRQEMLLQEAREQDAASAALVGMPGQQQQQQLARAAGLPDGCRLTGEQLKIVRSMTAGAGSSGDLVL